MINLAVLAIHCELKMKIKYKDTDLCSKKSFGQNFLTDRNISKKIVRSADLSEKDHVLEIGPGFGALTRHITEITDQFTAVELDSDLAAFIRENFPTCNLIQDDILKVDLGHIASEPLKILGNIPYNITSPILFHLIDHYSSLHSAVLMMQDEVARRITAQPGTKAYGILSVQLQTFACVEYLFKVKKSVFMPRPDVDSAVIKLTFPEKLAVTDTALFQKLVRTAFSKRRKTLANNLKGVFECSGLDESFLKKRAEELSVQDFQKLANGFAEKTNR